MQRTRMGVGALAIALAWPALATAQHAVGLPVEVERAVVRARAAIDAGNGTDARTVLDSLVSVAPAGSVELAEALFWRATLAERVGDAERDWKRLVIEAPLAPRATDALQRLGELEMLRGHPAEARGYFARIVREYPGEPRARSQLWVAKSWMAQRELPRACVALAAVSRLPEGELALQAEEMRRQCASVDRTLLAKVAADTAPATPAPVALVPAPSPPVTTAAPAASGGVTTIRYSVQLAALDTRAEADRLVRRLGTLDIAARVDGTAKPFRVRTGNYATRSDAEAALARFKRMGQAGFIVEIAK